VSPVAADNAGKHQKDVDRDKNREKPVPIDPDQPILHRHDDKERQEQRAMVSGAGRRQAHEIAKAEERKHREENEGNDAAKHEVRAKNKNNTPPRPDSRIEVCHRNRAPWESRHVVRAQSQSLCTGQETR
jgi:hypothetical protein